VCPLYAELSTASILSPMENASLPRTLHKISLGTPTLEPFHQPCFFFNIPIEIRKNIYRYIVISRLDCCSHPRLWRPLGVDGGIHRIGYFDRDTIIPLLQTSHRIHDEAASMLYGENTFAFHISGLTEGPIWFLEWLAPRYISLLRKVYIRTGYHVDTYGFRPDSLYIHHRDDEPTPEVSKVKAARDLWVSAALVKQAWPRKYKVSVNKHATVAYPADEVADLLSKHHANDWPASSYHLWKMFVFDTDASSPQMEFKRIEWGSPCVRNLREDGTRIVVGD